LILLVAGVLLLSACDSIVPPPPDTPQATPIATGGASTPTPLASSNPGSQIAEATLSTEDQAQRATQFRRYLALLPEQYEKSLSKSDRQQDLKIASQAELENAVLLLGKAEAAFDDLRTALYERDSAKTAQIADVMALLHTQLADAGAGRDIPAIGTVKANTEKVLTLLNGVMPAGSGAAEFTDVEDLLDRMLGAVASGDYAQAESLRLDAYATLESGPEAKLTIFAGQLVPPIESLFWYGQDPHGLASPISARASLDDIKATHALLVSKLDEATTAVQGSSAAAAVTTNAGIIVFREGLEAVLILASLLGSMKTGPNKRFRRPLSWGAVAAVGATVLTWIIAQGILTSLARYGEALEAVVSLIAIGVLLIITNWFFHNVYWTGWIANFHSRKKRLIGGERGQILGLALLGFTSIFREGFESVLFLQALVLESGVGAVLAGVAIGVAGTILVGVIVLLLQAKLPYKKMLVATGIMIGAVLLVMVGNTVHVLQLVGWLPLHGIQGLDIPYWTGLWFGLFPTWEGILLQIAAGVFVIGSYFLAEHKRDRRVQSAEVVASGS
jgi:high-affinity iron transporter